MLKDSLKKTTLKPTQPKEKKEKEKSPTSGKDFESPVESKDVKYPAPAPSLDDLEKKAKESGEKNGSEDISSGKGEEPIRRRRRSKIPPEPAFYLDPEAVISFFSAVTNILNSFSKTEVWAFVNDEEEKRVCDTIAWYVNKRGVEWLAKFAPEITLVTVLGAYSVPRIIYLIKEKKESQEKQSDSPPSPIDSPTNPKPPVAPSPKVADVSGQ